MDVLEDPRVRALKTAVPKRCRHLGVDVYFDEERKQQLLFSTRFDRPSDPRMTLRALTTTVSQRMESYMMSMASIDNVDNVGSACEPQLKRRKTEDFSPMAADGGADTIGEVSGRRGSPSPVGISTSATSFSTFEQRNLEHQGGSSGSSAKIPGQKSPRGQSSLKSTAEWGDVTEKAFQKPTNMAQWSQIRWTDPYQRWRLCLVLGNDKRVQLSPGHVVGDLFAHQHVTKQEVVQLQMHLINSVDLGSISFLSKDQYVLPRSPVRPVTCALANELRSLMHYIMQESIRSTRALHKNPDGSPKSASSKSFSPRSGSEKGTIYSNNLHSLLVRTEQNLLEKCRNSYDENCAKEFHISPLNVASIDFSITNASSFGKSVVGNNAFGNKASVGSNTFGQAGFDSDCPIKAVVFDFDDTLLESECWKREIFFMIMHKFVAPKLLARFRANGLIPNCLPGEEEHFGDLAYPVSEVPVGEAPMESNSRLKCGSPTARMGYATQRNTAGKNLREISSSRSPGTYASPKTKNVSSGGNGSSEAQERDEHAIQINHIFSYLHSLMEWVRTKRAGDRYTHFAWIAEFLNKIWYFNELELKVTRLVKHPTYEAAKDYIDEAMTSSCRCEHEQSMEDDGDSSLLNGLELGNCYSSMYIELMCDERHGPQEVPGATPLLHFLHQNNIQLYISSMTPEKDLLEVFWKRFGVSSDESMPCSLDSASDSNQGGEDSRKKTGNGMEDESESDGKWGENDARYHGNFDVRTFLDRIENEPVEKSPGVKTREEKILEEKSRENAGVGSGAGGSPGVSSSITNCDGKLQAIDNVDAIMIALSLRATEHCQGSPIGSPLGSPSLNNTTHEERIATTLKYLRPDIFNHEGLPRAKEMYRKIENLYSNQSSNSDMSGSPVRSTDGGLQGLLIRQWCYDYIAHMRKSRVSYTSGNKDSSFEHEGLQLYFKRLQFLQERESFVTDAHDGRKRPNIRSNQCSKRWARYVTRVFGKLADAPDSDPVNMKCMNLLQVERDLTAGGKPFSRDQIIMVGDGDPDYHGARSFGCRFMGVQDKLCKKSNNLLKPQHVHKDCHSLLMTFRTILQPSTVLDKQTLREMLQGSRCGM